MAAKKTPAVGETRILVCVRSKFVKRVTGKMHPTFWDNVHLALFLIIMWIQVRRFPRASIGRPVLKLM